MVAVEKLSTLDICNNGLVGSILKMHYNVLKITM